MKTKLPVLFVILALGTMLQSCSKNSVSSGPVYPVTATILNPAGLPQAGAILELQGKPDNDPVYAAVTDSTGTATIKAPAGNQTLVGKMGSVFQVTFSVNVAASQTPTLAGTHQVVRNTALKVLVVQGDCEETENVLRSLNFGTYDSIYVDSLINNVAADSNKAQTFLAKYTLVFSDCDCGIEGDDSFAQLSREYGRYIKNGGKIFGGHYNYYHLQRIFPPYFTQEDYQSPPVDSIHIVDPNLSAYVGAKVLMWVSADSRNLSGYDKFTDLPPSSVAKTYAYIEGTSPIIYVIVENTYGSGTYVWTDYHNQDVIDANPADVRLTKIVEYFLYK